MDTAVPENTQNPHKFRQVFSNTIDFLFSVGLTFLGVIGYIVSTDSGYWDRLFYSPEEIHEKVGTLYKIRGEMRFRRHNHPVWHDLGDSSPSMESGDTIFTGKDGEGLLVLDNGDQVSVMPNTLIVLNTNQEGSEQNWWNQLFLPMVRFSEQTRPTVKLESGKVKIAVKQKMRPVQVQVKNHSYQLKPAKSTLNEKETIPTMAMPAVEFVLDKGNDDSPEQMLEISSTSPDAWDLQVQNKSKDTMPAEPKNVKVLPGSSFVGKLEEQLVLNTIPWKTVSPSGGEKIFIKGRKPVPVSLNWVRTQGASAECPLSAQITGESKSIETINLEIESNQNPTNGAMGKKVSFLPGQHQWRLSCETKDGRPLFTNWARFSVVELLPPRTLGPLNEGTIFTESNDEQNVHLSWDFPKETFELRNTTEVEYGLQNTEKTVQKTVSNSNADIKITPGSYQWRVRLKFNSIQESEWSPWSRFNFRNLSQPAPPSPNLKMSRTAQQLIQEAKTQERTTTKRAIKVLPSLKVVKSVASTRLGKMLNLDEVPVQLEWQPIGDLEKYKVIVYKPDGELMVEEETKENNLLVVLNSIEKHDYKYIIVATLKSGETISSVPIPIQVTITSPVPKYPKDKRIFAIGTRILITWEKTSLNPRYFLQISAKKDFKVKINEITISDNYHVFDGSNHGTYFWRVKSLYPDRESKWSEVYQFQVQ